MKNDTTQLVALSVRQPYAAMIMLGMKGIETKATTTKRRGTVLVHASSTMGPTERAVALAEGFDPDSLPRGCVLGSVDIVDSLPVDQIEGLTAAERRRGDYRPGRWGWKLERVQPLAKPIACKGALSFWKVPANVEQRVRDELRILDHVFVYGTLKRGLYNHRLLTTSRYMGTRAIRGRMHSLGGFPAVTLQGRGEVSGELYAVDQETMAHLDRLEGCPSFYQRTRVRMSTGERAWVYVMDAEKLRGRDVVASGNWGTR